MDAKGEKEQWIDHSKNVPKKQKSTLTEESKAADENEIFAVEFRLEVEHWKKQKMHMPAEMLTFGGHMKEKRHEKMMRKLEAEPDYDSTLEKKTNFIKQEQSQQNHQKNRENQINH